MSGLIFLSQPDLVSAANPSTMNFQGKVVNPDGTNVTNGSYSFSFRIYSGINPVTYDPNAVSCTSDSNCKWEETQSSLLVSNGIFQVELGTGCSLTSGSCNNSAGGPIPSSWSNSSLYLTMKFNSDAAGYMTPLIHLQSVPFAFNADNLGGIAAANYVQLAQGLQADGSTTNASIAINKTGSTANILTLQKSSTNVLVLDNSGLLSLQPAAALTGTGTQILETQTLTNNQTAGTVNGLSQVITVSNSSGTTTTNGLKISLTDNASSLANTNTGIVVSLTGSNSNVNQIQYGIDVSVDQGVGIRGLSTGYSNTACANLGSGSTGVCGDSTNNSGSVGVYGRGRGSGGTISGTESAGVIGYNDSTGGASAFYSGVKGFSVQSAAAAYTSLGVYGKAQGGAGSTIYGGYFDLGSSSATAGSSLFSTNGTATANIFQLQDNTTNVLLVGNEGDFAFSPQGTSDITLNLDSDSFLVVGSDSINDFTGNAGLVVSSGSLSIDAVTTSTTATTNSNSGLEIGSDGLRLLGGCTASTADVLKWNGSVWACASDNGTAMTIGSIDSQTKSANGAVTASSVLYMQTADLVSGTFYPGLVGTGSQTITGTKTLAGSSFLQTPGAAIYKSGADASGSINTGTDNSSITHSVISGKYLYAAKAGSATACSQTVGSAIGCELQVYDVTDPSTPKYIGGADASGSTNTGTGNSAFNSIAVTSRYVFVVKTGDTTACSQSAGSAVGCELQVYDISKPSSPTYVGGADVSGSANSGTGGQMPESVKVSGQYAYILVDSLSTACSQSVGSAAGCELQVYDVSNAASPRYIGGADISGSSNSGTGSANTSPYPDAISVSGRYVYTLHDGVATACSQSVGSAAGCELQVYDVSNPASPTYVGGADESGSTNSGTEGNYNLSSVTSVGRYAYLTLAAPGGTCSQTAGSAAGCELQVYDISNPASPTYVGGADASGTANSGSTSNNFNDLAIAGRYAYVAQSGSATACTQTTGSGAAGCELQVYDISNPASPSYAAGMDVTGSATGASAGGFKSARVSGRYVYTTVGGSATTCSGSAGSAIGCEIQAYDISGVETTSLTAGSLDAGLLSVRQDALIFNDLVVGNGLNVGINGINTQGGIAIGPTQSGTDLSFANTSSVIRTVAPAAGSVNTLTFTNTNSQNLLQIRDLTGNTNAFGGLAISGGFVGTQTYFGEEFNVPKSVVATGCSDSTAAAVVNTAERRGDFTPGPQSSGGAAPVGCAAGSGELGTSSDGSAANSGTCVYSTVTPSSTVNGGVERIAATGASGKNSMCLETNTTTVAGTQYGIFNTANLPQVVMKVRPSQVGSSNFPVYVGLSNRVVSDAAANAMLTANIGYYFTNCSAPNTPTCTTSGWTGVVADGVNATPATVTGCQGTAISTSVFSYLRIETRKATTASSNAVEVQFFADFDTSNGISEISCGTITTSASNFAAASNNMGVLLASASANATAQNLDTDYVRVWQDDAPAFPVSDSADNTGGDSSSDDSSQLADPPLTLDGVNMSDLIGMINFGAATSEDAVFNNDVYVHGTLYADKIKANQIEGMQVLTDKINSLSQKNEEPPPKTEPVSSSNPVSADAMSINTLTVGNANVTLDLKVLGTLFANGSLVVNGEASFNNDVTFGGHVLTKGNAPMVELGSAAGSETDATASIDGNDISGQVTIKVGSSPGAGNVASIKFNKAYSTPPRVVMSPANNTAADIRYYVQSTKDGFNIVSNNPLTTDTTLIFTYRVN